MTRGRGKQSTGSGRRGRSASVAGTSGQHAPAAGVQLCGTCSNDVGDNSIGCDECEIWVCKNEMCSGLPMDMLRAIDRYNGAGIKFVCMKCRIDFTQRKGNSPTSTTESHMGELVGQLFQQVKGLCSKLQQLMDRVDLLAAQPRPAPVNPTPQGPAPPVTLSYAAAAGHAPAGPPRPPPDEYRVIVREEMRELEEQRKRRSSLVIRGLEARSANEAISQFKAVTEHLVDHEVTLTDVVRITSEGDLYRGKVTDDDLRKLVLEKAKHLKNSIPYGNVFIRRDLTFKQRQVLKVRRAQAQSNNNPRPENQIPDQDQGQDAQPAHPGGAQGRPPADASPETQTPGAADMDNSSN